MEFHTMSLSSHLLQELLKSQSQLALLTPCFALNPFDTVGNHTTHYRYQSNAS